MMQQRIFANTDISLSLITFGVMRLTPDRVSRQEALRLLHFIFDRGVNTIHSSHEYETYDFFCEVWQKFLAERQRDVVHIAKIPVPHFKDNCFSAEKLEAVIDQQLKNLNTDKIDIVQWMLRHEPNTEEYRLPMLTDCREAFIAKWQELKQKGKVISMASFPYSHAFADQILQWDCCDGLTDYLNLLELQNVKFLDELQKKKQGFLAIRPLKAAAILQDEKLQQCLLAQGVLPEQFVRYALRFALLHPVVASAMVSVSSIKHAEEVLSAVENLEPDCSQFERIVVALKAL